VSKLSYAKRNGITAESWSEEDLVYLAGFLDGEGCFQAYEKKMAISCTNTYKPTLDWIKQTFGGNISTKKSREDRPSYKNQYEWAICTNDAKELLSRLIPFLKEKQNQAVLLFTIIGMPKQINKRHPYYKEITEEKMRLRQILKDMKYVSY